MNLNTLKLKHELSIKNVKRTTLALDKAKLEEKKLGLELKKRLDKKSDKHL